MKRVHKMLLKWKRLIDWRASAPDGLLAHWQLHKRLPVLGLWSRWVA